MSTLKRILIVGPILSRRGGVAHHVRTLLNSPLKQNYEIHYFRVGSDYHDNHLKIISRFISTPFRFIKKLWTIKPQIVHFNPSFDLKSLLRELIMLVLCKRFGYSTIVQFHGGNISSLIKKDRLPFYIKLILKYSSRCVVLTETQKNPLLNFVPEDNIVIIPNMVDTSIFNGKKLNKGSEFVILFMSRIDKTKGVYSVIEAIPHVIKKISRTHFLFAGEGPDKAKLEQLCNVNGLSKQVKFLGHINEMYKINLLAKGDLFLFPSQLCEGMPYALLEAMAAGLPIIATPVGAIPEIIKQGENGFLVPLEHPEILAETIIKLLKNKRLRAKIGKFNRYTAKTKYDIKIVIETFSQLYESTGYRN